MTRLATGTKYGNRAILVDGVPFDSVGEASRWRELQLLERAGAITALQRQVRYELLPALHRPGHRTEPALRYTVDFQYTEDGRLVAEEFKGFPDTAWRLRRRLFLHRYPEIELRVTGRDG